MPRYPKLSLDCGYWLARSPLLSRDPRRVEGSPAGSTDSPSAAPKAAGGGQKQRHSPGPERSLGGREAERALQDPEKARGASSPQGNFPSEEHDVRGASPGGQRQMSSDSGAPWAAGVLPGLQFQLREVGGFAN